MISDDMNAESSGFKRIKRSNDEEKARYTKPEKCTKLTTEEYQKDTRQQKRQSEYFETRNKR